MCERKKKGKKEKGRKREALGRPQYGNSARQEHYQEKMFRDCALERDVFGSLVRTPRSLSPLRIALFHPCLPPRHAIATPPPSPPPPSALLVPSPFSLSPSVSIETSCRGEENQHQMVYSRCNQNCDFSPAERSEFASANDDREKAREAEDISQTLDGSKIFLFQS